MLIYLDHMGLECFWAICRGQLQGASLQVGPVRHLGMHQNPWNSLLFTSKSPGFLDAYLNQLWIFSTSTIGFDPL
jgi:hypothetical protein